MGFSAEDKKKMLQLKGVGPTVIIRLEALGLNSLQQLANMHVQDILQAIAKMLNSTCWQNSPQARACIQAIIDLANQD
jgi:nucleotidyltransferase/DNA polymerase involved in DNA repair